MNDKAKIMVCGDVHANWSELNTVINKKQPDIILQCGDFGFWIKEKQYDIRQIKAHDTKIFWCDGNHEDFESLKNRSSNQVHTNVFYMPRGHTMKLPDGRNVLFFGGADSYDKDSRTLGFDWFPDELPSNADFDRLSLINEKIDIVISHTCPNEFDVISPSVEKLNDPTRRVLSHILQVFKPSLWYFGHWHFFKCGMWENCHWTCLHFAPNPYWWTWLK